MGFYVTMLEVGFWIYSVANIVLCGWLAQEKNRSQGGWLVMSLLFGFLATAFLMAAPSLPPKS